MNAITLYRRHDKAALLAIQAAIMSDPGNRNTSGGLYIYTPRARRKLDAIAVAITMHMDDERNAAGDPVSQDGYTGRQSKR